MAETFEPIVRPSNPKLDEFLGKPIGVLDDGFVRVVDYMGTEASIVQAARVSYGKGTKSVAEDQALIRYLMRHRHTTPLEMCVIKFHLRMPIDVNRQHVRHRMSTTNEYSTRYSEAIDSVLTTPPDRWRLQSTTNKQGSGVFLTDWPEEYPQPQVHATPGEYLSEQEAELHRFARHVYEERLRMGVAREQARKDLPLSNYTELYWKIDAHNLLHYLSLRDDSHAQFEIREYARAMADVLRIWMPTVAEAFDQYRKYAVTLHEKEQYIIKAMVQGNLHQAMDIADSAGFLKKNSRERVEFEAKLKELGITPPWQEANLT